MRHRKHVLAYVKDGQTPILCQTQAREAELFRSGKSQAFRIPADFEFVGDRVLIRREGDRLILEPTQRKNLLDVLDATPHPLTEN